MAIVFTFVCSRISSIVFVSMSGNSTFAKSKVLAEFRHARLNPEINDHVQELVRQKFSIDKQ